MQNQLEICTITESTRMKFHTLDVDSMVGSTNKLFHNVFLRKEAVLFFIMNAFMTFLTQNHNTTEGSALLKCENSTFQK